MTSKRRRVEPAWHIILEDIRSQNRLTIEAVVGLRSELKGEIARLAEDHRVRFDVLELAIRDLRLGLEQNSLDIRGLATEVRGLNGRVASLATRPS